MIIRLDQVRGAGEPVRSSWDEGKLQGLMQSIKEQGLVVPIKVRSVGGGYEIVYGHRRAEACRRIGLTEIEAIVEGVDDTTGLIQGLIENVRREDMLPLDVAKALRRVKDQTGWSNQRVADAFGWSSKGTVSNYLSMLRPGICDVLSVHARELTHQHVKEARVGAGSDELAARTLAKAVGDELSTRETRRVGQAYKSAEDEAERQAIDETPYRDPSFARLVKVRTRIKHDVAKQKRKKRQEDDREVRNYTDAIRDFRGAVEEAIEVAEFGKFSPEAGRFVQRQHDLLRVDLENLEKVLQGGGIG